MSSICNNYTSYLTYSVSLASIRNGATSLVQQISRGLDLDVIQHQYKIHFILLNNIISDSNLQLMYYIIEYLQKCSRQTRSHKQRSQEPNSIVDASRASFCQQHIDPRCIDCEGT
jgi:hypothetical protein